RTHVARPLPSVRGIEITLPKRPGATLSRPHRVDRAAPFFVIKDALAVGFFPQTPAALNLTGVKTDYLGQRLIAELGNGSRLFLIDPNIARRSGTAMAAAGAAKTQAVLVPWLR